MRYFRGFRCAIVLATVGMSLFFVSTVLAERKGLVVEPLSFFPKAVVLGMSVGDLQKARPDARRFHITRDAQVAAEQAGAKPPQVDLSKGQHLFTEELSTEVERSGATYFVKDGIVKCVLVSKSCLPPKDAHLMKPDQSAETVLAGFRALRRKTFAECRERFGDQYRLEAVRVMVSDKVRYLAPRFSWVNDEVGVAFICTSEYQDVEILRGSVGVVTWLVRDGFKPPLPRAEAVDKQVLSRLAEPVVARGKRTD